MMNYCRFNLTLLECKSEETAQKTAEGDGFNLTLLECKLQFTGEIPTAETMF